MLNQAPSFRDYILHIARPGKNESRGAALAWLRDQFAMGLGPGLTLQTGLATWTEYYLITPMEHRAAFGKLWREYVSYRSYHRRKKVRLTGKHKRMAALRWSE